MAVVYRAEDTGLRRQVAVKVLYPHLMRKPEFAARFFREARAAAQLDHPHILRVFDVGGDSSVPDEPGYIVMELVRGTSLKEFLDENGPPLAETVAMVGSALAEALAVAHAAGVIHRDVKPANVMIAEGGRLVLCDFGVARLQDDEAIVTQSGALLGTPAYMAPEQALGKAVDARSDLYSLGATLYQLATGVLPASGTAAAVIATILKGDIDPPDRRDPKIGKELSRLIQRLMAREKEARYGSGAEAQAALTELHAAAGFADRDAELARYFAAPGAWNADALPRILDRCLRRAREAAGRREAARALGLADRVLAFDGAHAEALAIAASAGKGSRRLPRGALYGVLVVGAAAGAFALWRAARVPLPAPPPIPTAAPAPMPESVERAATVPDAAALAAAPDASAPSATHHGGHGPVAHVAARPADAGAGAGAGAGGVAVTAPPPSPPPDAGPQAPPPRNATLEITITPYCWGTLDGEPVKTPVKRELAPGPHTLVCTNPSPYRKTFDLAPGERKRFTHALLAPITITTTVDVRFAGVTRRRGERFTVEPGRWRVDVLQDDGPSTSLNFTKNCTIRLEPELACY